MSSTCFTRKLSCSAGTVAGRGTAARAVEQALGGFVMEAFAPGPRVVLAGLGEDAVPVGALLLAQGLQP